MVKFTSTVIAASFLTGSAVAVASHRFNFDRPKSLRIGPFRPHEMVEYVSRSTPGNIKVVPPVHPVHGGGRLPLATQVYVHGGKHSQNYPYHNSQRPRTHHGERLHPYFQLIGDAPVDMPAQVSDASINQRRSYGDYYRSYVARDLADGGADASSSSAPAPYDPSQSYTPSASPSASLSSVPDAAAPSNPPSADRSFDFDALYARYFDFDDLDWVVTPT